MPNLIKAVAFLAFALLFRLLTGGGCTRGEVHPTGNATYVRGESCTALSTVPHPQFEELLAWCSLKHKEEK